jgi:hypothetical protein
MGKIGLTPAVEEPLEPKPIPPDMLLLQPVKHPASGAAIFHLALANTLNS